MMRGKQQAKQAVHRVVFLRHGQSTWNLSNQFTGWHDVDLTDTGVQEAVQAGKVLKEMDFQFDIGYTSVLTRAIRTFNTVAQEMDQLWIPHIKTWRLNERHYGALQGMNKAETAKKHGVEQVTLWRRSYDVPPPDVELDDIDRHPMHDRRYQLLPNACLPRAESLKTTLDRVLPYWHDTICPNIKDGKNIIIVAHGNSLRAIVKSLSGMSNMEILGYNIPTGVPFVYEFDADLCPMEKMPQFLIDQSELEKRMEAVANQARSTEASPQ